MTSKAPPIQWLPVFEAAARHLNFRKAAEELCVSPPAVSQQIKVLEECLGLRLFDRSGKQLRLSEAGDYYYQHVRKIIRAHQHGYQDLERKFQHPMLQLSAPIFVAQELLIPNYPSFRDFAPNVELRLNTGNDYVDFESETLDAALRFGPGDWPELDCRLISHVEARFVCSPDYLRAHRLDEIPLMTKEVLREHVLISVYDDLRDWHSFVPGIETDKSFICDSYFTAIRSAEEGLGIAVGLFPVIKRLVSAQRLCVLDSAPLNTNFSYWLVSPPNNTASEHISALYQWLQSLFSNL